MEPVTPTEIAYEPSRAFVESTNVWDFMQTHDIDSYEELVTRSTTAVDGIESSGIEWFWDELVDYLGIEFFEDYDAVRDETDGPQFTRWYPGGELNVAHNTVDRHATVDEPTRNRVACIWEGEDGSVREVTYHELHRQSNQVANALEARGVETGDTVGLYMPMVPEVISILYGCFKVGAIAVPIFSGFGVDAVSTRLADAGCRVIFTGDGSVRRAKPIPLKRIADEAIESAGVVSHTIVFNRFGHHPQLEYERVPGVAAAGSHTENGEQSAAGVVTPDSRDVAAVSVPWDDDRDEWWTDAVETQSDRYDTNSLPSDSELMLLYSSGTTGKPKGIVHTHAGVQLQCAKELFFNFDLKPADRFFWVSDIGWMMGPWTLIGVHTLGGTVFLYEGAPDYPDPGRFWSMIDRHAITHFGISPTAIRALRAHDGEWLESYDLSSLRILGSTGEPWDPESWHWFYEQVGRGEVPIINISGGTEICGCFLIPSPTQPLKPCTLGGPGLGMDVDIVDDAGESIVDSTDRGYLVARQSCPSMTRRLWSGEDRYLAEYWSTWDDLWDHGDWAQRDANGFWFLHGRADDTLNVAGRKVGPAEIEAAMIDHEAVSQAAAVGVPDETTGTAVIAYVVLEPNESVSEPLRNALSDHVATELGKPFRPRELLFVDELPKTQSGKIVRRVIAATHTGDDPGDRSSIENPEAIDRLSEAR